MIKAKIIDVFSPDAEDLSSFRPDDPENFCILLQICVGISGDNDEPKSGETFDIEVYTPKWLLSNYKKNEVIFPRHSLIVFDYDYECIHTKIKKSIESCCGNSWNEVAHKIGRFASWEFEDYEDKI